MPHLITEKQIKVVVIAQENGYYETYDAVMRAPKLGRYALYCGAYYRVKREPPGLPYYIVTTGKIKAKPRGRPHRKLMWGKLENAHPRFSIPVGHFFHEMRVHDMWAQEDLCVPSLVREWKRFTPGRVHAACRKAGGG